MTLIAFHGDPMLKSQAIRTLKTAFRNGSLQHGGGIWWDPDQEIGCPIGVLTRNIRGLPTFEATYGIPSEVGCLIMNIFERLPANQARSFIERAFQAIGVGVDLGRVFGKLVNERIGASQTNIRAEVALITISVINQNWAQATGELVDLYEDIQDAAVAFVAQLKRATPVLVPKLQKPRITLTADRLLLMVEHS